MADGDSKPDLVDAGAAQVQMPAVDVAASAAEPVAAPAVAADAAQVDAAVGAAEAAAPAVSAEKTSSSAEKPSLLETFDKTAKDAAAKPTADKPAADVKPETKVEAKPADGKAEPVKDAAAEVAKPEPPAPIDYKFEWPETIKPDAEKVGQFTSILNEARVAPEVAQKLAGLHADTLKSYDDFKSREQHRIFSETRDGWSKDVLADPEIGGAGHITAMGAIARVRDALVSSAKPGTKQYEADFKAHEDFMRITGAGDHPVYLKMLHRAARFMDEPQAQQAPAEIRPPKGNGRAPKGGIYTHPSSQNMES